MVVVARYTMIFNFFKTDEQQNIMIKDEYLNWLPNNGVTSQNSIHSYMSYLNKCCELASAQGFDLLQLPKDEDSYKVFINNISYLEKEITAKLKASKSKSCNDWRSGLRKYSKYVQYRFDKSKISPKSQAQSEHKESNKDVKTNSALLFKENDKASSVCNSPRMIFPQGDLINRIKTRLRTQNRARNQKDVAWNIDIINYILFTAIKTTPHKYTSRGISQTLLDIIRESYRIDLDNIVMRTIVHTEDGTQTMAQIESLMISPSGDVHVFLNSSNNRILRVLTEVASINDGDRFEPLTVSSSRAIDEIVVDHIYRMENLLDDLERENKLPILSRLTKLIRDNEITIESLKSSADSLAFDFVVLHLLGLFHEVQLVNGRIILQLMHATANSSKH
jgi:hypothetical protein